MSLTLPEQPGFTAIPASTFDAPNPITSTTAKALNSDAQFAAVRTEEFVADYLDGETVALPVSPADAYVYSRDELRYIWGLRYNGSATRGQGGAIILGANGGAGYRLFESYYVDETNGLVHCDVTYYKEGGASTPTHDGVLSVLTIAKRLR
jgi:hypothetical protein